MLDRASSPAIENGSETLSPFTVVRSINLTGESGEAAGRVSFKSQRRPADLCAGSSTFSISGAERTNERRCLPILCPVPEIYPPENQTRILRFCYDTLVWTELPDRISDLRLDVLINTRTNGLREIQWQSSFKSVKAIEVIILKDD